MELSRFWFKEDYYDSTASNVLAKAEAARLHVRGALCVLCPVHVRVFACGVCVAIMT